ncbi:LysR family transcriptional regulator [Rhodobacterales bacterium HKCCE3408]|nr:LysR family transcriptional regulator [Rhodobacterales bacterium HKCCE3408]
MAFPASPITLRQLRYLLALEETRHFRLAAEACGISQPSLSVQIKALEETLSLNLVERGGGQVQMSVAGREVCRRAREILSAAQGLMDLSVLMKSGLGGTLRLGTSTTLGPYLMPHVIGDLAKKHPDLRLYIREGRPRDLLTWLNEGEHDLILTQLPVAGANLTVARLFREPLFVALPTEHRLAEQKAIHPSDLARETVLALSPNYTLHDQIAALAFETGAVLARDYEGTSLDALRQMVAMKMGITLLPALYVASEITGKARDVAIRPIVGRTEQRSIGLVWRSSAGAAEAYTRLAQSIRETASRLGQLTIEG